jgi:hypothetical protein
MTTCLKLTRRDWLLACSAMGLSSLIPPLSAAAQVAAQDTPKNSASFDESQRALLAAVANTIIPTTDTPGALDAGVPDFIEMMVRQWLHEDERVRFVTGMTLFDSAVRQSEGKAYTALAPREQLTLLTRMAAQESASNANAPPNAGPFIAQMKALTIFGYYTSQAGASQELELNLIPGRYEACHEMAATEHAPSLSRSMPVLHLP